MASSSTTITISSMLPVPALRLALVCIAQNRFDEGTKTLNFKSTDKLRRTATLVRRLSQKQCFFCARKRTPEKKTAKWEDFEICQCLADIYRVPLGEERKDWIKWSQNPGVVEEMLNAGTVSFNDPVYSLRCECGETEPITVSRFIAAVNVRRDKAHKAFRRCRGCQAKWRSSHPRRPVAAPAPTRAARPTKPKKTARKSAKDPLVASVAERAAAKGEPAA